MSLSIAALFMAVGCAGSSKSKTVQRFFWPPAPLEPKVEFIRAYSGEKDFPKTGIQGMLEKVGGSADSVSLSRPVGVYADGRGKVFLTEPERVDVVEFDLKNKTFRSIGEAIEGELFKNPIGITGDRNGNIYVSDSKQSRVFVFDKDFKPIRTIGSADNLKWPSGMCVDDMKGRLYVANAQGHDISVFDIKSGDYVTKLGGRGDKDGLFNFPVAVAVDGEGNIVVADSMNARIQVVTAEGKFVMKAGRRGDNIMDLQIVKGVAVDKKSGNIYVTDGRMSKILIFDRAGEGLTRIGGEGGAMRSGMGSPGGFVIPQQLYIDDNGYMYVADSLNQRVQVFKIIDEAWLKRYPVGEEIRPTLLFE